MEVELVTFEDEEGNEESWIVLERFKWDGLKCAFLLAIEDESRLLIENGKPVFLVLKEERGEFFELTDDEEIMVSKRVKKEWDTLNRKIRQLEQHSE